MSLMGRIPHFQPQMKISNSVIIPQQSPSDGSFVSRDEPSIFPKIPYLRGILICPSAFCLLEDRQRLQKE
jgi:hypothetical protein